MKREIGQKIAERMRAKGFTLVGWARANGYNRRTVNDLLYIGLGTKRGKVSRNILNEMKQSGFVTEEELKTLAQ